MTDQAPFPELIQPVPRIVKIKNGSKILVFGFVGLFMAIPFFLTILLFFQFYDINRLKQRGSSIVGNITKFQSQSGKYGTIYYSASYEFYVSDKLTSKIQKESGTSGLSVEDYNSIAIGSHVVVVYLPEKPYKSSLALTMNLYSSDYWHNLLKTITFVYAICGGVIIILLGTMGRLCLIELRLAKWGSFAPAEIIAEKEVRVRYGHKVAVTYRFRDSAGNINEGTRDDLPSKAEIDKNMFKSFDQQIRKNPTVLYDPKHPSRNKLYPLALVTISKN